MTDDEIRQQAQDSFDANPAYGTDLPIPMLQYEIEALREQATRSVSWIDGVIEILELYRPETQGQRDWQKRMVTEGHAIIQAHVDARMKEERLT